MEKDLGLIELFELYQGLLTERQRELFSYYYLYDLSLSEIADGLGISRQGVRHLVKKGEEQLDTYENKLGLANFYSELGEAKEKLEALLSSSDNFSPEAMTVIQDVVNLISDK